jgi:hypothetical protein
MMGWDLVIIKWIKDYSDREKTSTFSLLII